MSIAIIVILGLFVWIGYSGWRASRRLSRGEERLEEAWRRVEEALTSREQALRGFCSTLASLGLVPEGRRRLEEALGEVSRAASPAALAEADERLKIALREVYGGLPRTRPPALKQAQNALAEAEDELEFARRRYNELVMDWNELFLRRTYRYLARRKGLSRRELYLLPGEEEAFSRHRGPSLY